MFELTSRLLLFISLSDSYNKKSICHPERFLVRFQTKGVKTHQTFHFTTYCLHRGRVWPNRTI